MQVEKVLYVTQCCAIFAPRTQNSGVLPELDDFSNAR